MNHFTHFQIVGLLFLVVASFWCGWLAYSHFLKHAEMRSDRRCQQHKPKRYV